MVQSIASKALKIFLVSTASLRPYTKGKVLSDEKRCVDEFPDVINNGTADFADGNVETTMKAFGVITLAEKPATCLHGLELNVVVETFCAAVPRDDDGRVVAHRPVLKYRARSKLDVVGRGAG